ncbi:MAG: hypothetical protein ACXADY_22040 [Candidatus Hodarchaeales archaeon]|jgi:hypothetical protein
MKTVKKLEKSKDIPHINSKSDDDVLPDNLEIHFQECLILCIKKLSKREVRIREMNKKKVERDWLHQIRKTLETNSYYNKATF